MIFTDGKQDEYDYIFPKPKNEVYYEDKAYALKETYSTDDLVTFYNECKDGNADITFSKNAMLERDEYELKIDEDGITITSSCDDGKFRAVTSLRQLVRQGKGMVICCEVKDKPAFKQRAFMLDISRQRKPKMDYIKHLVDMLAGLKYNEFQLYMEDFCFKYSEFPEYTKDFDCLTPEDIHELDAYCIERFIELVPNQNGFGHMESWLSQEEYKHLDIGYATMNILEPDALELMDKIYGSLLPHFSSKRVHIGLDEAMNLGMGPTEEACRERGKANVFMDWLNKLSDLCEQKYGKTVQFWADMVYNYPESYDRIPKNAIPVLWGYEDIDSQLIDPRCKSVYEAVGEYYVAPSTVTWLDFTGRFECAQTNVRTFGEVGELNHATGYLLTHWCNPDGPSNIVWGYLPTALAAQYSWNTGITQHCGWRKPYFEWSAENYLDEYVFGGAKVSRWLRDLGNYYLLEPERLAVSTVCGQVIYMPVSEPVLPNFFDCRTIGDTWYFEDVIRYMKRGIDAVSKLDMDDTYKREIIVNSQMVVACAELAIAKHDGGFTPEKADEVAALFDWIIDEHQAVWRIRNFEKGLENFVGVLKQRRSEIKDFIKR